MRRYLVIGSLGTSRRAGRQTQEHHRYENQKAVPHGRLPPGGYGNASLRVASELYVSRLILYRNKIFVTKPLISDTI